MPTTIDDEVLARARLIWDYHHLDHELKHADCIIVLGSHDTRVAERGAELFLQGLAPLVLFSGGLGNFTRGVWDEPEAEKFARVAREMGVPANAILVENESTNSGENAVFSRRLLEKHGLDPDTIILVQKPYMERRALATFEKHWPGKKYLVTSPQIPFEDYPTQEITLEDVIHIMVGDLQRIMVYPRLGYQIEQEIPRDVVDAFHYLVERGFTNHLLNMRDVPGEGEERAGNTARGSGPAGNATKKKGF